MMTSATNMQKSALNIVMGAMNLGKENVESVSIYDLNDVEAMFDIFRAHGHTEIDTSRFYGAGTSQRRTIGLFFLEAKRLQARDKGLSIQGFFEYMPAVSHAPEELRENLITSLKALNTESLEIWYLHGPDRSTPYEVTMKAVNNLYKEGYFKAFGLSNYMSWEVAEIVGICNKHGYVLPTIYQGVYNAVQRSVEPELIPCLRKFNISYYAFGPLGGGFFAGRYVTLDDKPEPGSWFDTTKSLGKFFNKSYWNAPYFSALDIIRAVGEKYDLTMGEIALRWISHHSVLRRDYGDSVLVGASNMKHLEQNLLDLEKGPLPEEVVKALDDAWIAVKPHAMHYYH